MRLTIFELDSKNIKKVWSINDKNLLLSEKENLKMGWDGMGWEQNVKKKDMMHEA